MNKKLLISLLLVSSASVTHAGFFDSLFGSKSEEKPVAEASEAAAASSSPAAETGTMDTVVSTAMGLLPTLTSQLGVSDSQAEGGMGSLMNLAKGALSTEEFGSLSQGVPGMDTLLAAAPALSSKGGSSGLSGMLSNAGGLASTIGGLGQITEQFEALGLSPDMIAQFATIAIGYFTQEGNNTGELLQKGLSSILG